MRVAAGMLGSVFALLHSAPFTTSFNKPVTLRGSHENASVPHWARALWLPLAATTLAGSIAYLASDGVGAAAVIGVGAVGIWMLAIANGIWIHGRPAVSHHMVEVPLS